MNSPKFEITACLPFVELSQESTIQIGPVLFWPASKSAEFIEKEHQLLFQSYIQSIFQIKTKIAPENSQLINTVTLTPEGTTCLSISSDVPPHLREQLIVDALYSLYFICNFRNLYYGSEVLKFEPFRKVIPASLNFLQKKENWEACHIEEMKREETVCIHLFDQEMNVALGKALSSIYQSSVDNNQKSVEGFQRVIRSIRFLVDRFFQRFVNLFANEGLHFKEDLFEPEDILFLASSFDCLFNIDQKEPAADFKHKLRPMLHLKYSRPVEIFWKWADDFYEVRRRIVHRGEMPEPIFKSNPNFEISHLMIGIKLFIYAVYNTLFEYHLLAPVHFDAYTPPDFRWIHPEEILLFFWTESSLLENLNVFIKRGQEESADKELFAEISLLSDLFLSIYERYYLHPEREQVKFIPTPLYEIKENGLRIIEMIEHEMAEHPHGRLLYAIPTDLLEALKERLILR